MTTQALNDLADKVVIANATGNETLYNGAVSELLTAVRALATVSSDAQPVAQPSDSLTARAFAIADEAMIELLHAHCIIDGPRFCLAGDGQMEVAKMDDADQAIRDAFEWLQERGLADLAEDEYGEYILLKEQPETTASPAPDVRPVLTDEQKDAIYNAWRDQGDAASYGDLMDAVERAALAAQAAPSVPQGMLIGREPTDAMQAAGAQAIRFDTTLLNKMWTANAVFRAMWDAAQSKGGT